MTFEGKIGVVVEKLEQNIKFLGDEFRQHTDQSFTNREQFIQSKQ